MPLKAVDLTSQQKHYIDAMEIELAHIALDIFKVLLKQLV